MRKWIALLLALATAFCLIACEENNACETQPGETISQETGGLVSDPTTGVPDATEQTQPQQGVTEPTTPVDTVPQPSEGTILETIPGRCWQAQKQHRRM